MSAEQGTGRRWEDFTSAERAEMAEVLNSGGPERSASIIRATLTPEQQPHAEAIIAGFEDALFQASLTRDERIGTALVDAHRRGEDPAGVARRWL